MRDERRKTKDETTKVAVVTGTRAEFGIWGPVMYAISKTPRLELQLIVTGMHLQRQFGHTVDDIEFDHWPIAAKVPMYKNKGWELPAAALGRGIAGLASEFDRLNPDVVMVLGDRLEILAAASAAMIARKIICHVHGGETAPGQYDEQIRHAVTKMAHVHFCATETAGRRIRQMGENPKHVHVVGAPALDWALEWGEYFTGKAQDRRPILILHPGSPVDDVEEKQALMLIDALLQRFGSVLAIGPNNDPGHLGILGAYRKRRRVDLVTSLLQEDFWQELVANGLLVGNSSSGILEAATLGCAVVNVGERQAGRERSGNVLDVPWNAKAIGAALERVRNDPAFDRRVRKRANVYGDGKAAGRIVGVLRKLNCATFPRTKRFFDQ